MSLTLFLGHGKTEMRGGPAIFMSIYRQWPEKEKYIVYEKSYIQSVKKLVSFLRNNRNKKVLTLILENEYFTEVFLALLLKIFYRNLTIYGPAYHIPSSPVYGKGFINSIVHYLDYRLGLWFMAIIYSGIYTENSYMKNYIKGLNPKQRVIVESPGIKGENIIPLGELKNYKRDIDLLYLTSMTKNKGIYDFLNVANQIQRKYNNVKIGIAGYSSPAVLDYIENFMKNNNMKNIEIYPNINDTDKYKLYSRSKIYVLPSVEDGIPITFYEAWSYGVVVIAYNLETYSDIKDYFIQVEKGNVQELTDKCIDAYRNYNQTFSTLVENSYNYSLNHSFSNGIDNIIKQIMENNDMIRRAR